MVRESLRLSFSPQALEVVGTPRSTRSCPLPGPDGSQQPFLSPCWSCDLIINPGKTIAHRGAPRPIKTISGTSRARTLPHLVNSGPAGNIDVSLTTPAVTEVLSLVGPQGDTNQNCGMGVGTAQSCTITGGCPSLELSVARCHAELSTGHPSLGSRAVGTGLSGFLTRDTKEAQRASRPPCTLPLASAL